MRRKDDYLTVKSLGGAKMRFGKDNGWAIKAIIDYGRTPIHVTYYRSEPQDLPRWKEWNGVTVPEDKQIIIDEWWKLEGVDLKAVADEVKYLFEIALIAVMLSA